MKESRRGGQRGTENSQVTIHRLHEEIQLFHLFLSLLHLRS